MLKNLKKEDKNHTCARPRGARPVSALLGATATSVAQLKAEHAEHADASARLLLRIDGGPFALGGTKVAIG